MHRLLILLAMCAMAASQPTWTCGDGYVHPYFEQCDPGTRCVRQQNQTMYWTGAGTAPSFVKHMMVEFQYAPLEYINNATAMPVYGLHIYQGASEGAALLQTNAVQYGLFCESSGIFQNAALLTLRPANNSLVDGALTAQIRWTYSSAQYTSSPCSAFMRAVGDPTDWRYVASLVTIIKHAKLGFY